jgi:hypothetical protein
MELKDIFCRCSNNLELRGVNHSVTKELCWGDDYYYVVCGGCAVAGPGKEKLSIDVVEFDDESKDKPTYIETVLKNTREKATNAFAKKIKKDLDQKFTSLVSNKTQQRESLERDFRSRPTTF